MSWTETRQLRDYFSKKGFLQPTERTWGRCLSNRDLLWFCARMISRSICQNRKISSDQCANKRPAGSRMASEISANLIISLKATDDEEADIITQEIFKFADGLRGAWISGYNEHRARRDLLAPVTRRRRSRGLQGVGIVPPGRSGPTTRTNQESGQRNRSSHWFPLFSSATPKASYAACASVSNYA
jgi:hypothetical protein